MLIINKYNDMEIIPNYIMSTEGEIDNVYETSFVDNPATGKSFLRFNDDSTKINNKLKTNLMEFKQLKFNELEIDSEYERVCSGVWMMPDTKYLRVDEQDNLYTVQFSKEGLKDALIKYLRSGYSDKVKVEHTGEFLEGFVAIEHWIIEDDNTKSPVYGLSLIDLGYEPNTIPSGTVMKSTYVQDEMFWNDMILTGKVKGYSIGGLFNIEKMDKSVEDFSKKEISIEKELEQTINIQDRFKSEYIDRNNTLVLDDDSLLEFKDNVIELKIKDNEGILNYTGTLNFNSNDKNVEFEMIDGVIVDYLENNNVVQDDIIKNDSLLNVDTEDVKETKEKELTKEELIEESKVDNKELEFKAEIDKLNELFNNKFKEFEDKLKVAIEFGQQKEQELKAKNEQIANMQTKLLNEPLKPINFKKVVETKDENVNKLRVGNQYV